MMDNSDIDETFHRLTRMAARVFKAPIAAICTINMEKLWFANRAGISSTVPEAEATNVYDMFCQYQIRHAAENPLLVVLDTTKDPRFHNYPLAVNIEDTLLTPADQHSDNNITAGGSTSALLHFYVGRIIKVRGMIIGTFCIMDIVPHDSFTTQEQTLFEEFTMMLNELLVSNEEYVSHLYQYEQEMVRERETANVVVNILSNLKHPLHKVTKASKQLQRLVCPESRRKNSYYYTAVNTSRTSKRLSFSSHRMSRSKSNVSTGIANRVSFGDELIIGNNSNDMIMDDLESIVDHHHSHTNHHPISSESMDDHMDLHHHERSRSIRHEEQESVECGNEEGDHDDDVVPFSPLVHQQPPKRSISGLRTISRQSTHSSMGDSHHSAVVFPAPLPMLPHVSLPPPIVTASMIQQAITQLQQSLSFLQSMIEHTVYMNTLVLSSASTSGTVANTAPTGAMLLPTMHRTSSGKHRPNRRRSTSMTMVVAHSINLLNLDQYLAWCMHEFQSSFNLDCSLIYHDATSSHVFMSGGGSDHHEDRHNVGVNVSLLWMILFFILSREGRSYSNCQLDCKVIPNEITTSSKEPFSSMEASGGEENNSFASKTTQSTYAPILSLDITFSGKKATQPGISCRSYQTNSTTMISSSSSSSHLTNDGFEEDDDFGGEDDIFSNDSTSTKFDYHSEEMVYFQRFLTMFSIDHSIQFSTKSTVMVPPPIVTSLSATISPLSGGSSNPSKVSSPLAAAVTALLTRSHPQHPPQHHNHPAAGHHVISTPASPTSVTSKQSHHSTGNHSTSSQPPHSSHSHSAVQLLQRLLKNHSNMLSPRQSPRHHSPKNSDSGHSHHSSHHCSSHSSHSGHHTGGHHHGGGNSSHTADSQASPLSSHKDSLPGGAAEGHGHGHGSKQQLVTWKLLIPTLTTINNNPIYPAHQKTTTSTTAGSENDPSNHHPKRHRGEGNRASQMMKRRASVVQQHTTTIPTSSATTAVTSPLPPGCEIPDDQLASHSNETMEDIQSVSSFGSPLSPHLSSFASAAAVAATGRLTAGGGGLSPIPVHSHPSLTTPAIKLTSTPSGIPPPRLQSKRSFRSFNHSFSMVRTYSRLPISLSSLPHVTSLLSSQKSTQTNPNGVVGGVSSHGSSTSTVSSPHLFPSAFPNTHSSSSGAILLSRGSGVNSLGSLQDQDAAEENEEEDQLSDLDKQKQQQEAAEAAAPKRGYHLFSRSRLTTSTPLAPIASNPSSPPSEHKDKKVVLTDEERRNREKATGNDSEVTRVARLDLHQPPAHHAPDHHNKPGKLDDDEKGKSFRNSGKSHPGNNARVWCFLECVPLMCYYREGSWNCLSSTTALPHSTSSPKKGKATTAAVAAAENVDEVEESVTEQAHGHTTTAGGDEEPHNNPTKKLLKPAFHHHPRRSKPYQIETKPPPSARSSSSSRLLRWVSGWLSPGESVFSSIRSNNTTSLHGQLGSNSNSINASVLMRVQALGNNPNNPTAGTNTTNTNNNNANNSTLISRPKPSQSPSVPSGGNILKKIHPIALPVTSSHASIPVQ